MNVKKIKKFPWASFIANLTMVIFGNLAVAGNQDQSRQEGYQLTDYSFDNRVQMVIDDYQNSLKGIKLIMKTEKKGHIEILPVHLDLKIQCEGQKQLKVVDIVTLLKDSGSDVENHYRDLFSTIATKDYPNGQLRFCAFESLNFDQKSIMLKVLKGKSGGGCEQSYTVDFEIPISTYCER